MKKKLPQSLLEKQEAERAATAAAVTDAIIELNSQGYDTRIKDIISVTGFSRSLFAKSHIRRILVEYGVVKPVKSEMISTTGSPQKNVNIIIAEKDGYIDKLLFENEQLTKECEILRGRIHLLSHKISAMDNNDF